MIKIDTENGVIELTAEEYEQQFGALPEIDEGEKTVADVAKKLAEGLATATTIAQIRSVAKAILTETGGENG